MNYAFFTILSFIFMCNTVCADENEGYLKYKDVKFDKVLFDDQFFSDILLEKDVSNAPKYEEEKNIIQNNFPSSVISPFTFDALNTLKTDNKTVMIVFRDHSDKKLHALLQRFLPIQPFVDSFKEEGTVVSFVQMGENGCNFLIVKQSFNFQEEKVGGKKLSGKGLSYVLNHLTKVVKTSLYKSRFRSYKPGDDYSIYRNVKDTINDGGVAFEWGYFDGYVYINPSLGFSIDLPQWETVRKVQKDLSQEEGVGYFFGQMNLFLFNKYPQAPDILYNPEMCLSVVHVKAKSLESYLEENDYKNIEKEKISGKDIYTFRRSYPVRDHETGRPLDHLSFINQKIIFFKKNGLIGEMGIKYGNDEQERELAVILETIQLK